MRTTIELPDALFRQAKTRAAMDGTSLKNLITRWVEQGLRRTEAAEVTGVRRRRSKLPVGRSATGKTLPILNNAELHRLLLDEEITDG